MSRRKAARRLGREAPAPLVHPAAPDRHGQPHEHCESHSDRGEKRRCKPPRTDTPLGEGRENRERREPEREVDRERDVDGTVVAPRPLDLLRAECPGGRCWQITANVWNLWRPLTLPSSRVGLGHSSPTRSSLMSSAGSPASRRSSRSSRARPSTTGSTAMRAMAIGKSFLLTFLVCVASAASSTSSSAGSIPWPSLFGTDDKRLREEDIVNRRRAWTWRFVLPLVRLVIILITIICADQIGSRRTRVRNVTWWSMLGCLWDKIGGLVAEPGCSGSDRVRVVPLPRELPHLHGPAAADGHLADPRLSSRATREWGVKLDDVRGQAEAKEEIRRVVTLWQSGEVFESAGGKRERGLIFHGAPGTGKTMMAKAIATGFNSPFVSIPGSGFAPDVHRHRRDHRPLPRPQGEEARPQVGRPVHRLHRRDRRRRHAPPARSARPEDRERLARLASPQFYGRFGAINPSGDLICENEAWREWMFRQRAPEPRSPYPGWYNRLGEHRQPGHLPGDGRHGRPARAQPAARDDGRRRQPAVHGRVYTRTRSTRSSTRSTSSRGASARFRCACRHRGPLGAQIYFIGATNVPLEALDPALTRPGRMGRHVHFRTPTKDDRKDIFDLYLDKVAHDLVSTRPSGATRSRASRTATRRR